MKEDPRSVGPGTRRSWCRPGGPLRILMLAVLALLWAPSAQAQRPDLRQLDVRIGQIQEEWPVPGLAVAIVKDGETVLARGYGSRKLGGVEPVDEHTLFAIASNTKAFTAAALTMLAEEDALDLDDPVRSHLPYFRLYNPFVSQEMRIRDLLCHRSGLGTFSGDLLWYGTDYSAEEVVRRARHLEPAGPFRASYGYSNLMFIAAGEVVAAGAGVPWGEFVETRILDPLGMSRSVTSITALSAMENVATPHKNTTRGVIPIEWYNWDAMAAAGGIISSVSDMAKWMRLLLAEGDWRGENLLSRESIREMWTVHTPRRVSSASRRSRPSIHFRGYGLGFNLNDDRGRLVVSHGGGYDGMFSRLVLVPEENLGVVVLTNSMTPVSTAIANVVLDAYLGGESRNWSREMLGNWRSGRERFEARQDRFQRGKVEGTRPSLSLEGYTGRYGGPMYGDATVTEEDGGLVLRLLPNPDLVADLTHLHHDTFLLQWRKTFAWFGKGVATFVLDPLGKVREMKLEVPNDDLWFYELDMKKEGR